MLDKKVLKQLFPYIKPYRKLLVLLIFIMVSFAMFDSVLPIIIKTAVDRFAKPGTTEGMQPFLIFCAVFALLRGAVVLGMIRIGGIVNTGLSYDVRETCFRRLQELPFSFFDKHSVGSLLTRLTSDAEQLGRVLSWGIVDVVDGFGKLIFMTIFMFMLDVKLALVVLAVVPALFFVVFKFKESTLNKYRDVRRLNSDVTAALNEGVEGAVTTKTLVREKEALKEFRTLTESLASESVSAASFSALYLPLVILLGAIAGAAALRVGGAGVMDKTVSYGTLIAFFSYAVSFFQPLQDLAKRLPQFQNARAAAERIFSVIETEPEIQDTPAVREMLKQPDALPRLSGALEFRNINFQYVEKEPVLTDFNLSVKQGETVAIVGETGSGKTTIISLACRFYEPTSGQVLFDGKDYRTFPLEHLQQNIAIVQQTPHLFSGTIRENIHYGNLNATEEQIEEAIARINAEAFIQTLKNGLDFQVGEGGANLSTGQKQLISLARILIADPSILFLDEATSSVDAETEHFIQEAVKTVMHQRTSFIIAHRLSTILAANRIIHLSKGKIIEQGTHRELLKNGGPYYRLYSGQFITEHENALLGK